MIKPQRCGTKVYCKAANDGASAALTFGSASSTTPTWTAGSWSVAGSSDGADYMVSGTCSTTDGQSSGSTFGLGDTTSGLKNNAGALEKR